MSVVTPKIGKKGAAERVAKKATAIRRKPLSKKIFEIIDENFEKNSKDKLKKSAKTLKDAET